MSGEVTPSNYEIEILAKDARRIPVEISASQIEYGGKPADMAIIRDITERKRAEDALRQSEERYRDLFDNAHDLIQSVSPEGQLLYVNQTWQNALGYSEKEIANLKIEDIIHPSSINHCMEIFQRVLAGEDTGDIESTFVAKDGSLVAVEGNAHCRSVDGRPISTQGIFRDVTTRKMAEEALRESEERYRALVDLGSEVGEAVVMLQDNEHGNAIHVFFNREWPRITGYSREELLKMSFFDLISPEDRKASQERHQRKMRGEAIPGLFEIQIIRKDGAQVPVEVTSAHTKYLGGTANVAYIRDITERKQAEAKHQAIIKTAVDGFWIADSAGRFLEVNDSYCEMVGYTQEELSKMSISDIEAIDTPKDITRRMKRIMKQGYDRFETRHKHKDGRIIDVDVSANYSDVGEGQMFVFIRDITERKRAEEALRESEERYRSLVNNVKLGILRSTPGPPGKILEVNPALEEINGYSRDELLAMDMEELYVHCEERQALMAELALAKGTVSRELNWRKKDGSEIVVLDTVMTVRDDGGKVLYFDSIVEDITERKQAEESLKASEEKLRLMFKSVPEGITVSDLEGNIRDTNEAAVHMHGYDSKEEMIGKGALELIAEEDHASAIDNLKETLEEGLSPTVEYTFLKKEGSKFPAELSAALLKDGAGNPVGFIAVTRDITERKQAEEALRESEERYKSLVNNVKLGIFRSIMTGKGRALEVNPALEEITGYSRKELLKMEFAKLYAYPEERRAFLDELVATKKPVNRELHWKIKDGREIVIMARTAPVTNNAGKIVCLDSIVEDITKRKQAEQLYYTLANSSPVGVYIEQDRKLIFTNPAFQKATDFTADELMGKDPSTIVYPEDRESVRQNAVQMLKGHRLQPYEFRYVTKSGEIKWGIERVVSVTYQGRQAALGDFMDITERKKMEEQLILTDRLASVGELASGIAHELNNPLTGVIGLSQILTQRDVPEDIKEDLNLVYSEAQRAATIVKNLLTFARKHSPAKDLLNINDVIGKVLELRAYEQRVSNIEVVTHLAPDLPQIMADYFQLQQVFLNIVINAEHFMIEAHNKGTLTITTERAGDYVRASFTDDGPGIPKENLGHIFDPFFTTKEVGKGTGLGLSICHGIISAHNGQIYAESEPDKGATFVIELPLSQEEQQDEEL
jgi:PAS domain S-box-containing protein